MFAAPGWLPRTVGAVLTVALASAAARRTRLPRAAQPLLTLTALAAYLVLAFAASTLHLVLLPGRDTVRAFGALLDAAGVDLTQYATPVAGDGAARPAGRRRRRGDSPWSSTRWPPSPADRRSPGCRCWCCSPCPSGLLLGGLGWVPFVLGATGWLALLLVDGQDAASRWGTPQRTGPGDVARSAGWGAGSAAPRSGSRCSPPRWCRAWTGGCSPAPGTAGPATAAAARITTYNPITRLRGELTLPEPGRRAALPTDDAEPDYLRMTTLDRVRRRRLAAVDVLRGNLRDDGVDDPLPTPVGLTGGQRTRPVVASVTIDSLDAYWLPAPATPSTVDVGRPVDVGPEEPDASSPPGPTPPRLGTYSVQATRVLPDADPAGRRRPAARRSRRTSTPVDADRRVAGDHRPRVGARRSLRLRPGRGAAGVLPRPGEPLRLRRRRPRAGGSPDALEDFLRSRPRVLRAVRLRDGRHAAARRRALPGWRSASPPGTAPARTAAYVVTTDDAHAWPEAWFAGAGWVRFEPTPSRGGITAPVYAAPAPVDPTSPGAPADTSSATPGDTGDLSESAADRKERLAAEAEARALGNGGAVAGDRPTGRLVAGGAVALLLLAGPAALHRLRRYRRWARPTPEAAWQQLTEDASDLGHGWRDAESPGRRRPGWSRTPRCRTTRSRRWPG